MTYHRKQAFLLFISHIPGTPSFAFAAEQACDFTAHLLFPKLSSVRILQIHFYAVSHSLVIFQLIRQPEPVAHFFRTGVSYLGWRCPFGQLGCYWLASGVAADWTLKGGDCGSDDGDDDDDRTIDHTGDAARI